MGTCLLGKKTGHVSDVKNQYDFLCFTGLLDKMFVCVCVYACNYWLLFLTFSNFTTTSPEMVC